MIRLSLITDEASQNLKEALEFARRFGLGGVELRLVNGRDPFSWTRADVDDMAARLRAENVRACCLSLPFFKCEWDDAAAVSEHIEHLKRCLDYAHTLTCSLVRGFDFWRHDGAYPFDFIVDTYRSRVAPLLEDAGVTMALETEPSVNACAAAPLARELAAIASPRVRALYDGGNLIFSETAEEPVEALRILAPYLAHVHVKDAVGPAASARAVRVGTGEAQTARSLRALDELGYDGWASLETHYRLDRALDDETLKRPAGAAFSDGGWDASWESMEALARLLRENR